MQGTIIIVVAAVIGFFGYQYAVHDRGPGEAWSALFDDAAEAEAVAVAEAPLPEERAGIGADPALNAEEPVAMPGAPAAPVAEEDAPPAGPDPVPLATGFDAAAGAALPGAVADDIPLTPEPRLAETPALTAEPDLRPGDLLTMERFEADSAIRLIDASDLSQVQKRALAAAVAQAVENPALLPATLERLREALAR